MITVLLVVAFSSVFGQDQFYPGKCPFEETSSVKNFQSLKFKGAWYEIQNKDQSSTSNIQIMCKWHSHNNSRSRVFIKCEEMNLQNGKLNVVPREIQEIRTPLWIIETGHETYVVLWSYWHGFTPEKNYNAQRRTVLTRKSYFKTDSKDFFPATTSDNVFHGKLEINNQSVKIDSTNNDNDDTKTLTIGGIISTIVMVIATQVLQ